jgi:hypothetical protein
MQAKGKQDRRRVTGKNRYVIKVMNEHREGGQVLWSARTKGCPKPFNWSIIGDTRRLLTDCPTCELDKARRDEAHGLFRAQPIGAPRARYAMDFQGQGKAVTGECEALAFIDIATRYVTVIALPDRKVQTLVPAFLDHVVFQHGPPEVLHSDEAPEFMSAVMQALAEITETAMTTTLGHNARSNGTIEVFWVYWNRCMRMLSDAQYTVWSTFRARCVFAYNTAPHQNRVSVVLPHMKFTSESQPGILFPRFSLILLKPYPSNPTLMATKKMPAYLPLL